MSVNEKEICRLCFNVAENKFKEINEIVTDMLDVLLLNIDLNVIENRIICPNCTAVVKRLFYFKSMCVATEKLIVSLAVGREETKVELKNVLHNNRDVKTGIEDFTMCRFCMDQLERCNFVSMNVLMEEALSEKMLSTFMPEMYFSIVNNSLICTLCKENLECYFKFVRNCCDEENKINTYCSSTYNTGQLKSTKLFSFLCNCNLGCSDKCVKIHFNKRELVASEEINNIYSPELMKIEEVLDIKDEVLTHKDASEVEMYKCEMCSYATKRKFSMKRHMLTHKDASEVDMYKCSLCTYETKDKGNLKRHMVTHKDASELEMYKCALCSYVTKVKGDLKRHMLTHKDASEVDMYKCALCTYVTKYKGKLKPHMLTHKDASQLEMYKCALCTYEAKRKSHLKGHMLTHMDALEGEKYKCTLCTYVTKRKHSLKRHMQTHRDGLASGLAYAFNGGQG